jgi:hypothetical protein
MKEKIKFSLRSFTSFALVISTLIMSWSGFILYVAPPGRIANWGSWKLMLFTKTEWQALHTIFSYIFFILVIIHLFFVNWKTFFTYFKSKLKKGLNKKWELASASVLSIVIFIGTLRSWTPFGPVMSFGEKIKGTWEANSPVPPVMHMEIYTLEKLSYDLDSISPADLLKTLRENNISVTGTKETLKEIANENKTIPSAIYEILSSKYKKPVKQNPDGVPQGIGKYTLKSAAVSAGKEVESLIGILKSKGIDANGETSLRTIADQLGMTPRDVYTMLTENQPLH